MRLFKLLLTSFAVSMVLGATAQDIHYTQYYMSPLTLNPALTGGYEGTFRMGGIYRDQWRSVLQSNVFQTPSFYVDAPAIYGFRKQDWVGAGFVVVSDQAGSTNYSNLSTALSAAYHLSVGKPSKAGKYKTVLSIGAQVGREQKRFDQTLLRFEEQWDGQTINPNQDAGEGNFTENTSLLNVSSGINLRTALGEGEKIRLNVGGSAYNLNAPTDGFRQSADLGAHILAHLNADIDLNEKLILSPGVFFQSLSGAREVAAIISLGYRMNENLIVSYGQGYRHLDATNTILGLQYNNLKVGISYDINVSKLAASSNARGGIEIAVGYIFKVFTDPKVTPVIFCPGF